MPRFLALASRFNQKACINEKGSATTASDVVLIEPEDLILEPDSVETRITWCPNGRRIHLL
jgi:hypothetical protein